MQLVQVVAQKFTSTTLPRRSAVRKRWPCRVEKATSGAAGFWVNANRLAAVRAMTAMTATILSFIRRIPEELDGAAILSDAPRLVTCRLSDRRCRQRCPAC